MKIKIVKQNKKIYEIQKNCNKQRLCNAALRSLYYMHLNNYKQRFAKNNKQKQIVYNKYVYILKKVIKTNKNLLDCLYVKNYDTHYANYIIKDISITKIIMLAKNKVFVNYCFNKERKKYEYTYIFIFLTNLFSLKSLNYFLQQVNYLKFTDSIFNIYKNKKSEKIIKNIKKDEYVFKKLLNNKKTLKIIATLLETNNNSLHAFLKIAKKQLKAIK